MSKQRKAFSWSLSLIIHSLLAILIVRTSYKLAFPEGAVETVSFETFGDKNSQGQTPPAPPQLPTKTEEVPSEPKVPEPKVAPVIKQPPQKSAPKTVKQEKTKFLPDKNQNAIQREEDSHAQETPETQETSPVVIPENQMENQKEQVAEQEQVPTPLPPAPPVNETANTNGTESPVNTNEAANSDQKSAAESAAPQGQGQEARPQFGTPGSMLDETKLVERAGNRKPTYPWMARLRRQQGTVILKAFVKKDGVVDSISLYQSSGHALLDKEALEAYSKWKYTPGASGWVLKPFKFSLVDAK